MIQLLSIVKSWELEPEYLFCVYSTYSLIFFLVFIFLCSFKKASDFIWEFDDLREAPFAVGSVWEAMAINIINLIWDYVGEKPPGTCAGCLDLVN